MLDTRDVQPSAFPERGFGIPTARYLAAQSPVKVELKDASGASVGTAQVTAAETGVSIALGPKNLLPGEHAIHIHQAARCEAPGFTTAGRHFNLEMKKPTGTICAMSRPRFWPRLSLE